MSTTASPSDLRCTGTALNGGQCHERRAEGSMFCARHTTRERQRLNLLTHALRFLSGWRWLLGRPRLNPRSPLAPSVVMQPHS